MHLLLPHLSADEVSVKTKKYLVSLQINGKEETKKKIARVRTEGLSEKNIPFHRQDDLKQDQRALQTGGFANRGFAKNKRGFMRIKGLFEP